MTVRFSYEDSVMHLVVWLDGIKIETLEFSIGVIISSTGKFFWLLKFDVPEVIKLPKIFGDVELLEETINWGLNKLSPVVKTIGFVCKKPIHLNPTQHPLTRHW
jgi:hypothetical protein